MSILHRFEDAQDYLDWEVGLEHSTLIQSALRMQKIELEWTFFMLLLLCLLKTLIFKMVRRLPTTTQTRTLSSINNFPPSNIDHRLRKGPALSSEDHLPAIT